MTHLIYFEKYISVNKTMEINSAFDSFKPQIILNLDVKFNTRDYYFLFVIDLFSIFYINIHWDKGGDHAGFHIDVSIPFYYFNFQIRDNRHWNHDNDCWEVYHKEGERVNYDIFKFIEKDHGKWYFFKTWRVRFEYRNREYVRIKQKLLVTS